MLVARYYGMRDQISLRRTITIMLRLCLAMATLFCSATVLAPEMIMKIYTTEEAIIRHGVSYLKIDQVLKAVW